MTATETICVARNACECSRCGKIIAEGQLVSLPLNPETGRIDCRIREAAHVNCADPWEDYRGFREGGD